MSLSETLVCCCCYCCGRKKARNGGNNLVESAVLEAVERRRGPWYFRTAAGTKTTAHNTAGHGTTTLEIVQDARCKMHSLLRTPQQHASKQEIFAAKGYVRTETESFSFLRLLCLGGSWIITSLVLVLARFDLGHLPA
jgi:hypothetical protein